MESETEAIKAAVIKLEIEASAVTAGTLEFTKAESLKAKVMNLSDRLNNWVTELSHAVLIIVRGRRSWTQK